MSTAITDLVWIPLNAADDVSSELRVDDEPFPPREVDDIDWLTRSVKGLGILSPILVRRKEGRLQIVCGYRRFLAARAAGLERIPALLKSLDDAEALRCYHEENVYRKHPEELDDWLDQGTLPGVHRFSSSGGGGPLVESPVEELKLLDLTESAGAAASAAARPEDRDEAAERVLIRTRAFFDEVRVTRAINVPRTEILVDSVLELIEGDAEFVLHGYSRPADGDFTAPHSILVTQLCARVAQFLAWDEEATRVFVLGGFLHDVGMTFVRETASRATGALTPADVQAIQSHTRIGCALIAGAQEWHPDVSAMARDHHERWNGTGYPEGKRGTEILFVVRLLGLVDTYAALITPRPHRGALEAPYAQELLVGALERGLWDPSVRPILLEALPRTRLRAAGKAEDSSMPPLTRNSVELRGDLVTMLAKGST